MKDSPFIDKNIPVHKINFLITFIWFQFWSTRKENLQLYICTWVSRKTKGFRDSFFYSINMSYIKSLFKSLIVFLFLWFDAHFLDFFGNETTLRKTSFSASFSSKRSCKLSSIAKASPEFTTSFELISIASSISKSEPSLSDSTFGLINDWIHSDLNSCLQPTDHVFTTGSQVSKQSLSSRNSSTVALEQSSFKSSSNHGQPFHQPQHQVYRTHISQNSSWLCSHSPQPMIFVSIRWLSG